MITIVDSGISLSERTDHQYNRRHLLYTDFIDSEATWKDEVGHGTHLATLLRRLAPDAFVLMARVFRSDDVNEPGSIARIANAGIPKTPVERDQLKSYRLLNTQSSSGKLISSCFLLASTKNTSLFAKRFDLLPRTMLL